MVHDDRPGRGNLALRAHGLRAKTATVVQQDIGHKTEQALTKVGSHPADRVPGADEDERSSHAQQVPIQPAHTITIDSEHAGRRLDKFLRSRLRGVPAGLLFRLLRRGRLRVNGRKTQQNYRLEAGDVIDVPELRHAPAASEPRRVPAELLERMRDTVLYEDQDLLIIDKPAGIPVHRGTDAPAGVIETLRQLRPELPQLELSHRLDRQTSGVLALAKSPSMLRYLHRLLRDHEDEIERHYLAVVVGSWPSQSVLLDAPLRREETGVVVDAAGQRAETHVSVRQRIGSRATMLNIRLLTGRKHQIRVHLSHAGHPIVGDVRYGNRADTRSIADPESIGLCLHASKLVIPRPDGGELVFSTPMPQRWDRLLKAER